MVAANAFTGRTLAPENQRAGGENAAQEIAAADYSNRIARHVFGFHAFTPAAIFTACRIR